MAVISINYDVLDEEGNNILNLCDNYDEFLQDAIKNLNSLKNSWNSNNALLLENRIETMINNVNEDMNLLREFGNLIIKVRKNFSDNEQSSAQKIKNDFADLEDELSLTGGTYYE